MLSSTGSAHWVGAQRQNDGLRPGGGDSSSRHTSAATLLLALAADASPIRPKARARFTRPYRAGLRGEILARHLADICPIRRCKHVNLAAWPAPSSRSRRAPCGARVARVSGLGEGDHLVRGAVEDQDRLVDWAMAARLSNRSAAALGDGGAMSAKAAKAPSVITPATSSSCRLTRWRRRARNRTGRCGWPARGCAPGPGRGRWRTGRLRRPPGIVAIAQEGDEQPAAGGERRRQPARPAIAALAVEEDDEVASCVGGAQ